MLHLDYVGKLIMEKQLYHLLINKNPDLEAIRKMCLDHKPFLDELVGNLTEKKETIRYNSVKILTSIAEEKPEKMYPYWNLFRDQLYSQNTYHILTAIVLISRLIAVDQKDLFSELKDDFFNLMYHENVIPVRYLLLNIWRVGKARHEYIPRISEILFSVDKINQEHKGLLKGDALLAFTELWDLLDQDKKIEVMNFAKNQVKSDSPKTRKEAKKFLENFKLKF